jgi:O-antigen/teichoic acid export membrane protein
VAFAFGYSPMVALLNFSMQIAVPTIYESAGKLPGFSSYKRLLQSVDLLAMFMLVVAGIFSSLALLLKDLVKVILLGEAYSAAADLLPSLLLAGGLFAVGEAKAIFLNAILKNKLQIFPKISLSLLGVVLIGIATREYGASGAASAVLGVSLIYACWMSRIAYVACRE